MSTTAAAPSQCSVATSKPAAGPAIGRYRWTVCALLFASTTICYVDRQIFGLLKPTLDAEFGWSETAYGDIVATFSLLYALGYLLGGRLMDAIGVRRGLSLAVTGWSVAAAAHGLASGVIGFKLARGALGLFEGGNYPASIKAIREWFPARERALATGLFNAGSNLGAIVTPVSLPFVVAALGWRAAFLIAGMLGLVWLVLWLRFYEVPERQRRLSTVELAYIGDGRAGDAGAAPAWLSLLRRRGTLAYVAGMLVTNPVWWFYLNWVPGFLHARFGVNMMTAVAPLVVIYLIADTGSILGGWLSSRLIARGWRAVPARLGAMAAMTGCTVPVVLVASAADLWSAVLLIALAAAGHQGFSANLYTIVSDTMPGRSISSVIGIGGFAAGICGMFVAMAVGRVLDATGGDYSILFIGAGVAYPVTVAVIWAILRRPSPTSAGQS